VTNLSAARWWADTLSKHALLNEGSPDEIGEFTVLLSGMLRAMKGAFDDADAKRVNCLYQLGALFLLGKVLGERWNRKEAYPEYLEKYSK